MNKQAEKQIEETKPSDYTNSPFAHMKALGFIRYDFKFEQSEFDGLYAHLIVDRLADIMNDYHDFLSSKGEEADHSGDANDTVQDYNKLKEAFEELLSATVQMLYSGNHEKSAEITKNVWREKAGLPKQ